MSRDSLKAQKNDQNLIVLLFVYCLHLLYIHNYGSKMHTFLCPEVFVFIYAFDWAYEENTASLIQECNPVNFKNILWSAVLYFNVYCINVHNDWLLRKNLNGKY